MRGWMNEARSYSPPVELGEVMRGGGAGIVEKSNNPAFKSGDAVQGVFGVQRYAISKGERVIKVDTSLAPLQRWIGGLGMPGWTAYFGLLEVGQPKPGETVVVSAAAGAVGSVVGQIAKIKGCRAVGIAGGPEKCRYVTQELGFDACIDYKASDLAAAAEGGLPQGHRRQFRERRRRGPRHGPVADERVRPHRAVRPDLRLQRHRGASRPKNIRAVLTQRLKMQGLIVFDWSSRNRKPSTSSANGTRKASSRSARTYAKAASMPSPTCSTCSTRAATSASWCSSWMLKV